MRIIRTEVKRRFSSLIAEKSIHRSFVGPMARAMGAVPVARAQDSLKAGKGKIYLPDAKSDPTLVRGIKTAFGTDVYMGSLIVLPSVNGDAASTEVAEIIGPEELRVKRDFKGPHALRQLTGRTDIDDGGKIVGDASGTVVEGFAGSSFKTAPKVDQSKVYDAVFQRFDAGGCVCIFPEGGSHDRTELLPLKRWSFSDIERTS